MRVEKKGWGSGGRNHRRGGKMGEEGEIESSMQMHCAHMALRMND